jgi:protein involved in sex pheromone biosynthesis
MTSVMELQPMSTVAVSEILEQNNVVKTELRGIRIFGVVLCLTIVMGILYYSAKRKESEKR